MTRAATPSSPDAITDLKVLELLAVLGDAHDRGSMLAWERKLRPYLTGRALGSEPLRKSLARLVERGHVVDHSGGRQFVEHSFRHGMLAALRSDDRLAPLTNAIREHEPVRGRYAWQAEPKALTRELAWALHQGLHPDAAKELVGEDASREVVKARALLALEAWGLQPSGDFSHVPATIVQEYVPHACALACDELVPIADHVIAWIETHADDVASSSRSETALYLGMRGELARAHALLEGTDDPFTLATRSFLALAADDFATARALARSALERTRTKSTKRIKGIEATAGVWLALALFTDRDAASHPYARAQLEFERKHGVSSLVGCLEMLDALVSKGADSMPALTDSGTTGPADWLDTLFFALLGRFCGKSLSRSASARVEGFAKRASSRGFRWVSSALEAVGGTGNGSLLKLYVGDPPWQRKLRALAIALAEDAAARPESGEDRLAWVVTFGREHEFTLTAWLQMRAPSGWSRGRQLSWKRLTEAQPSATYVSELDRRVLRHIRIEREYNGYGSTPRFSLDAKAVLELAGHPHVFVDGESRTPVEVTRGVARVEVRVDDQAESVLTLAPEALLHRAVVCEREGEGRLVVYALDEAQTRVARVFDGAPIRLPSEAQPAMEQTLEKLASRFSLASEHALHAAQIDEVRADGQLRVRLRRRGESLTIRVCVVPLSEAPAFAPGHGSSRLIVRTAGERGPRSVCAVRELDAERQALESLYARCPTLSDAVGGQCEGTLEGLESCLELLCELRAALEVVVEWPEGEPLTLTPERDVAHVRLRLQTETDWLAAGGELEIDESLRVSLHELLARAAAARSRFIPLDDGRYLALTSKLKKTLDSMSALAKVDRTRVILHPLWLSLAGARDDYAELQCDVQVGRSLERVHEASQLKPALPPGFEAELRSYQREGFEWLSRLAHIRAGACLADDMGLGKTLQALALLVAESTHGPCLVVAPTSVCANWFDAARRFAPALQLHELAGSDRAERIRGLGACDVLVCSYGILQQELEALSAKHFRVAILDEAQAIKNAATQRARAVQQLVADIRVALTGTPVENHLGDLWSIMHFLNPGLLGSAKSFEARFGKPIARDQDARASRTLKRLIRPFVLRRRKSEVLEDLPPKTVVTLRIEPSAAERALFAALRERAVAKLTAASAGSTSEARIQLLAELTRLRRAACHPRLVAPEADISSSKLEAFETLLAELREGGHRALVFSQFVDYLALVKTRLDAIGVRYQYLDGSTSPAARSRAVAAFQAGEGEVFLISLKAGGFGLNLTAADYVVHLDPWWNPAIEEQASDRAHRIGQRRPVTIYRLVMHQSVEEKILALHHEKRELADRLLDGSNSAGAFSVRELLELLQPEATDGRISAGSAFTTQHDSI